MFNKSRHKNSGMVLALTMIFLVVAVSLAGVLLSSGTMGLRQSVNQREAHQARLAAEGGMGYLSARIQQISLSGDKSGYITQLTQGLNSAMAATNVYTQGGTLYVPPVMIENGEGGSFSARITKLDDEDDDNGEKYNHCCGKSGNNDDDNDESTGRFLLVVSGTSGSTSRTISMELATDSDIDSKLFENGFLLGGKLWLTGNARFRGKNNPSEAQVLSNYTDGNESFKLTGNVRLDGDLHSANSNGYASLSGNVRIAGKSGRDPKVWDHIHFDKSHTELPRPDTTIFEPYATNVLSGSTKGTRTFSNIRIPANTNPHFSGNTTIKGVVYIESPNKVTFSGNLKITGVIVTEDPGSGQTSGNYLHFTGNTSTKGVEDLPDEPQYSALRAMPGAAILAPGFEMKFTGNFGTVGGSLVAETFRFTGNAGGTVKGPVISYSDKPFRMTGNAHLTIDRSTYDTVPPGFTSGKTVLIPVMSTYTELRN